MLSQLRRRSGVLMLSVGLVGPDAAVCAVSQSTEVAHVDLATLFKTKSPWRLVASQGPLTEDYAGNEAPGELRLCLHKNPTGACLSGVMRSPDDTGSPKDPWRPHYLRDAKAVYPKGRSAAPLMEVVTASLAAGDGDQIVVTQFLDYRTASDTFERVYVHSTGSNNNQEARYISSGPLKGSLVSAEPTKDVPYGYWIVVNTFTPERTYRQVLRYRSATHYNDGNSLAPIDSEMPNIQKRLGLWKQGMPLPLPESACPKPRLIRTELWCS